MSIFKRQLQKIIKEYRQSEQPWPATTSDMAKWALKTKRYELSPQIIEKICARDLALAMRQEYFVDTRGRRVRAKHPARIKKNGEQTNLWGDIRTESRSFMAVAFMTRRNRIVFECRQAKTDVDSYNDSHTNEEPLQMILDFTEDVAELELLNQIEDIENADELEPIF